MGVDGRRGRGRPPRHAWHAEDVSQVGVRARNLEEEGFFAFLCKPCMRLESHPRSFDL